MAGPAWLANADAGRATGEDGVGTEFTPESSESGGIAETSEVNPGTDHGSVRRELEDQ